MTIIFAALILVVDYNRQGHPGGSSLEHATQYAKGVIFFSLRGDFGLSGFSPVQFLLNECFIHQQPGRATVYHHANRGSMTFSEGGNAKEFTVAIHSC